MRAIDTSILESVCALLKPFNEATIVMSTESSSSVSLVRPLLKQLMASCDNKGADNMPASLRELRQRIYNDLELR